MLKKKFSIFISFILLVFALLTYQSIKGGGRFIDLPLYPLKLLERAGSAVAGGVKDIFNTYILIIGKEEENRRLRERLNRFEQEKNRYIETELENKRLRKILQLKSRRPEYVTTADVFARDPTNWFQMLWIDKGSEDGIAKDMVAIASVGPAGKVQRVFTDTANVILITDVNSSVAVRLQSSRVAGILEGGGDNRCFLKYVSKDVDVKVGERVVTSGLEGIYPEGLLIGYVTRVNRDGGEMFQLIEVTPAQDLNKVEEVAIFRR
ncbi:MAG: rod shape-determining protein MreC [Deferribacteres bacterium]|nr:rod shape-determining protein MreC [Deferribacteres bacterium]